MIPRHIASIIGRSIWEKRVGGLSVVALGLFEFAVQPGELCPRVRPRSDDERAVGQAEVVVEQLATAAAAFVDVAAGCGDLGVERVGQRYRAQIVVVMEDGKCRAEVGIEAAPSTTSRGRP